MMDNATWAVRDLDHGKTFFFATFEDMVAWVSRMSFKVVS